MKKIGALIAKEIREAVPATIFFLWLFHMIALTKAVTLDEYSITALRATVATVGALIVAKAILVVEALPIARLFSGKLWFHVLWKTLLYNLVVLIFRFIEEIIPLIRKHGDLLTAATQLYREISWPNSVSSNYGCFPVCFSTASVQNLCAWSEPRGSRPCSSDPAETHRHSDQKT